MTEAGATIESGNIRKPSSESELISSDILTVEELTVEVADIIKEEISSDRLSMHTEKQEDEETGPMLSSDNEKHCRDIEEHLKIVKDTLISKSDLGKAESEDLDSQQKGYFTPTDSFINNKVISRSPPQLEKYDISILPTEPKSTGDLLDYQHKSSEKSNLHNPVEKLGKKIIEEVEVQNETLDPPVHSDIFEPEPGIYNDLDMMRKAHEGLELKSNDVPEQDKYSENSQKQEITFQVQADINYDQNIIIENNEGEMLYNCDRGDHFNHTADPELLDEKNIEDDEERTKLRTTIDLLDETHEKENDMNMKQFRNYVPVDDKPDDLNSLIINFNTYSTKAFQ